MHTGTLVMPREEKDAQLVFRAEQSLKVELEAVAELLDRSSSKILRDILADGLPKWRQKADEEVRRRDRLPHGVTADALEAALTTLLRQWAAGGPLVLDLADTFAARSKALWVLLGFVWDEEPDEATKRVAARLAALVAKFTDPPDAKRK